jgi:hypothetical protein
MRTRSRVAPNACGRGDCPPTMATRARAVLRRIPRPTSLHFHASTAVLACTLIANSQENPFIKSALIAAIAISNMVHVYYSAEIAAERRARQRIAYLEAKLAQTVEIPFIFIQDPCGSDDAPPIAVVRFPFSVN